MGKYIIITLLSALPFLGFEMSPLSGSWITSIIVWVIWLVLVIALWQGWLKKFLVSVKDSFTATQMDDEEKGEHRRDIKGKLITWRKQLRTLAKKKTIGGDLQTDIENDTEIYQVLQHCPSLTSSAKSLGYTRLVFKAKLKFLRGLTKESKKYQEYEKELRVKRKDVNQKMMVVAKAIDICLRKKEYSVKENLCDWCKKHQKPNNLVSSRLLTSRLKLNVGKLLLDGKEILVDLEKMNGQLDAAGAASAELKFEIWYKDVSKTLQNTDYDRLWFENKEGLDYRKAKKSDYIETCKYGLDRLENIKQLMFDRGDSQK